MDGSDRPARLLIVDDHAFMRAGLKLVLSTKTDLEVVGEAADGEEALALCRALRPDLVLMDVTMPKMDGIEATRLLNTEFPETSILMFTAHFDQEMLMDAVRAGAAGYVLKSCAPQRLIGAIRAVLDGETPLDQGLAMKLLRGIAREDAWRKARMSEMAEEVPFTDLPVALTPREVEVLGHLAKGRTNRQIAQDLHLSLSTVKRHLERIIAKLGVSDRTQAAVRAVEMGLLNPRDQ